MDFLSSTDFWLNFCNAAASICMIIGYLPQAIYTIRTRDTDGIAMPTFLAMGLGSIFFVIIGLITHVWGLWLTNIITALCSAIIFGIKIHNDHCKKAK